MTIQESRAFEAAKLAALYDVMKRVEADGMTFRDARALMKGVNPKSTRDDIVIQLIVMRHKGYVEWPGSVSDSGKVPLGLRITEKGHEYFKRRSDCTAYDEV